MHELRKHLTEDCTQLDEFKKRGFGPALFSWPENSAQNSLELKEADKLGEKWHIWADILSLSPDYGPFGIKTHPWKGRAIQFDRVQQVWTLYESGLSMQDEGTVLVEFGGGTGQMASVVHDAAFKGSHFVYDFPEMLTLQNHFHIKAGCNGTFVLDSDTAALLHTAGRTNYLSNTEGASFEKVMALPRINFVATYSFTEADQPTRAKFMPHFKSFDSIYIVYWPSFDNIDNEASIKTIADSVAATHEVSIKSHLANGKVFQANRRKAM